MSKKVFIVVKQGVYRHEIKGSAFDLNQALEIAEAAIKLEKDDYHDMDICFAEAGKLIDDMEVIAIVSRNKAEILKHIYNLNGFCGK